MYKVDLSIGDRKLHKQLISKMTTGTIINLEGALIHTDCTTCVLISNINNTCTLS